MLIRSGGGLGVKVVTLGGGFAQALALEDEPVGVVHEAVENGIGDGWVADDLVPVVDGKLAGDDGRGASVAIVHDLEQVAAPLGGHWSEPPVVEDEKLDAAEGLEQPFVASVAAAERQGIEQPRQALIEDGAVVAACLVAERTSDPALAHAGWADDEKIVVLIDPPAGGELVEQGLVQTARGSEVDVLDHGVLPQAGELQAGDEAPVLALGGLAIDQEGESLLEIERGDVGVSRLLLPGLGHAGEAERDEAVVGRMCEHCCRSLLQLK